MESCELEKDLIRYKSLPDTSTEQVIESGTSILSRLTGNNYIADRAYLHSRIGKALINRGEYESAFRELSQGRQLHDELGDMEEVLRDQLAFGIIYGLSEQPETAFETFLTIRDKARTLELMEIEEASICNMGRICNDMNRFEEGFSFLKVAQKLVEVTGNMEHKAAVLHEIGRNKLTQGYLEEATPYLEEACQIASEQMGAFSYEVLISMGELYSRLSRFKEAFEHLNNAIDLCRQNNISHGEILALYHLGNLFEKTGKSEKAAECWEDCLKLSESLQLRQYRILSGERLVGYYRQIENYEQALKMLEMIRKEEQDYRNERLHHTISVYDQSTRIEDLDQEVQAWRKRSGELERIRSDKEESIRELKTIRDIGQELTASLDPDQIIEVLNNRLTQLVVVNGMLIAFYLKEEQELDIRYIIENGKQLKPTRSPVEINKSLSAWSILNDEDIRLNTRKESLKYTEQLGPVKGSQTFNESFLLVRLKIENRIIGVLSVQATKKNAYTERHLKVLQALAGFIAIALSNSNAHQSLVLANERIAYMATHDPMTGLPNRMRIMDRLEQELNRSRRYDKTLAVLFIDLDGFKRVNDTHGHQAGDFVLKQIAERLSAGIRATDAVGRLAGDEFLVIITDDCTRENGLQLAENLRKLLSEKIVFEKASLTVTGSVGLAFYPEDGSNSKDLVKLADKAMYKAKENGKNQIATQSSPL